MVAPAPAPSPPLDAFLAELLAEQQKLQTPVVRAATAHDLQPSAWRAEKFRELIPLTAPVPGQQYAFEVDLDRCTGCKACVAGCHSLNGLDDEETWRDVGLVYGLAPAPALASQTITTACHHCADPACLNGCPVLAYEKDPATGIVRHLDDQCIGCSYCVLKCPYDVPKYNARLGIVRKCDLCHGRLAAGEAPACAQACPTQAIKVVVVRTEAPPHASVETISGTSGAYTRPTTRYVSTKALPKDLRPADADVLRPQPAHLPLVLLLVFTQLALGLLLASLAESHIPNLKFQVGAAAALYFAGLAASVLHLGQPLRAWRVFLGLRRSWLSREAVLLGAAAPFVALGAASAFGPPRISNLNHEILSIAALLAALGVACSAALYIDTRRHFWRPSNTLLRMGGTVFVAALALNTPILAGLALALKLLFEHHLLRASPIPARLHSSLLRRLHLSRLALGAGGLALLLLRQPELGLGLFACGELLERTLYFRAVDAPKMPGHPA